ncbi:hypothetical protein DFH06DRAFT_1483268 [Mycena polygramma]|nr:hypothetical protein DFH06DRAFT_1483268 [Mycena polygramma]
MRMGQRLGAALAPAKAPGICYISHRTMGGISPFSRSPTIFPTITYTATMDGTGNSADSKNKENTDAGPVSKSRLAVRPVKAGRHDPVALGRRRKGSRASYQPQSSQPQPVPRDADPFDFSRPSSEARAAASGPVVVPQRFHAAYDAEVWERPGVEYQAQLAAMCVADKIAAKEAREKSRKALFGTDAQTRAEQAAKFAEAFAAPVVMHTAQLVQCQAARARAHAPVMQSFAPAPASTSTSAFASTSTPASISTCTFGSTSTSAFAQSALVPAPAQAAPALGVGALETEVEAAALERRDKDSEGDDDEADDAEDQFDEREEQGVRETYAALRAAYARVGESQRETFRNGYMALGMRYRGVRRARAAEAASSLAARKDEAASSGKVDASASSSAAGDEEDRDVSHDDAETSSSSSSSSSEDGDAESDADSDYSACSASSSSSSSHTRTPTRTRTRARVRSSPHTRASRTGTTARLVDSVVSFFAKLGV